MRPLLAQSHLGLGRLCARRGDDDRAEHHLLAATRLFVVMDMPLGVRDALSALSAVGSTLIVAAEHRRVYEYLTGRPAAGAPLRVVLDTPERETPVDEGVRSQHADAMVASHGMRLARIQ